MFAGFFDFSCKALFCPFCIKMSFIFRFYKLKLFLPLNNSILYSSYVDILSPICGLSQSTLFSWSNSQSLPITLCRSCRNESNDENGSQFRVRITPKIAKNASAINFGQPNCWLYQCWLGNWLGLVLSALADGLLWGVRSNLSWTRTWLDLSLVFWAPLNGSDLTWLDTQPKPDPWTAGFLVLRSKLTWPEPWPGLTWNQVTVHLLP